MRVNLDLSSKTLEELLLLGQKYVRVASSSGTVRAKMYAYGVFVSVWTELEIRRGKKLCLC